MTTNKELEPLQLAAALADEIYRRAPEDFAIGVERDLNVTRIDLPQSPSRNLLSPENQL